MVILSPEKGSFGREKEVKFTVRLREGYGWVTVDLQLGNIRFTLDLQMHLEYMTDGLRLYLPKDKIDLKIFRDIS